MRRGTSSPNAGGFIVAGVLLIWWLTHYPFDAAPAGPQTLAGQLAAIAAPVFAPIGIDSILSITLIFGFVAKEIVLGGLAVISAPARTSWAAFWLPS